MLSGMERGKITYTTFKGNFSNDILLELLEIYKSIFDDADVKFFKERFNMHPEIISNLAYDNQQLIGFKIGYPYNKDTFYSWIGGVLPDYRQLGIANILAEEQEIYAKKQRFIKLRTKSMNRFKPMMILNLKRGFEIIETYTNKRGQKKIIFEKEL